MHHTTRDNRGVLLSPLFEPYLNKTEKAKSKDKRAEAVSNISVAD